MSIGLASTSLCEAHEPMAETMPSPTRAMIVSSVERRAARAARVGAIDHLGVDARLHGLEHVTPGQVDGGRRVPVEVDAGAVGGNQGLHNAADIPAGEIVRLDAVRGNVAEARLHGHDLRVSHDGRVHLPQRHADEGEGTDAGPRHEAAEPQPEIPGKHEKERQPHDDDEDTEDDDKDS
jgi:hypothetical protein